MLGKVQKGGYTVTDNSRKTRLSDTEERLERLVNDYTSRKQNSLIQMKKGVMSREAFLKEAEE